MAYGPERLSGRMIAFFDDGSNCSVIRTSLAEELGLWGDKVTLELGTVNATTTIQTKLYCVELVDREGSRHLVRAFGLDTISGKLPRIDLTSIKGEFSYEVQISWDKMARPVGEVDILIGSEVAHLHPVHMETVGRMVVKTSIFGQGWVLNGAHEDIDCGPVSFDKSVQIIRSGSYRSNRIVVRYSQDVNFGSREEYDYTMTEKEFMSAEALGCEPPRRCLRCRGCKDCQFRGAFMSAKEALELKKIESKIWFDKSISKWRVSYPFLQDPRVLSNNYRRGLKMAIGLKGRIARAGLVYAANEVFDRGRASHERESKTGSYRLGIVIAVEKDSDGLVRTMSVEYILLSELPVGERLLYKGITKKRIRAPVQRLVLILPVEERNLDSGVDGGQDCLPGGQAVAAPHEEVVHGIGQRLGDRLHAEVGNRMGQGQGDGLHEGAGGQADVGADCQHGGRAHHCAHHARARHDPGKAYVTGCIRLRLKACVQMERDFPSEDFEAALYLQFCEKFDWSKVDEVKNHLEEAFEKEQGDVYEDED